jgi:hypothetical protein
MKEEKMYKTDTAGEIRWQPIFLAKGYEAMASENNLLAEKSLPIALETWPGKEEKMSTMDSIEEQYENRIAALEAAVKSRECDIATWAKIADGYIKQISALEAEVRERKTIYSEDRISLAQEIREGLQKRGFWVPKDIAGPDIINAIFLAIGAKEEQIAAMTKLLLSIVKKVITNSSPTTDWC